MAGRDAVVAESEILLEVALLHRIHVDAEGEPARERPVEPFGPYAAEHFLQVAAVDAVIVIRRRFADVGHLEIRQRERRRGEVFAQEGAHARQFGCPTGKLELVVVVDHTQPQFARDPGVVAQAVLCVARRRELIEGERVRPAERVLKIHPQARFERGRAALE